MIKSLSEVSLDTLYLSFSEAFGDYARSWTKHEFKTMLERRGYVPELSFGAFDGDKLVSFTLNGIGFFNGIKTAYDTGTGTLVSYRGKGLAKSIFNTSLPFLQEAGIGQYLLEVLQENAAAVSVYSSIGFTISRGFNYFVQDASAIKTGTRSSAPELRETTIDEAAMAAMWDFMPSWQNSFDAISRKPGDFRIIGAFEQDKLLGYGIVEPASGDIPQLAIAPSYRRKGIGSVLLVELLRYNNHHSVKVINSEDTHTAFTAFLEHHNIPMRGSQFEMIKSMAS